MAISSEWRNRLLDGPLGIENEDAEGRFRVRDDGRRMTGSSGPGAGRRIGFVENDKALCMRKPSLPSTGVGKMCRGGEGRFVEANQENGAVQAGKDVFATDRWKALVQTSMVVHDR